MKTTATSRFVSMIGKSKWQARVAEIRAAMSVSPRCARLAAARHVAEWAIEKARNGLALSAAEEAFVTLATRFAPLYESLQPPGRDRLRAAFNDNMTGQETLFPLLHVMHTAALQEARGFDVSFTGFAENTGFDLLVRRDGAEAEIACEAISAEDGHAVHRGAWTTLADRIDPDLQTWLAAHPGKYLLKLTLPNGLKPEAEPVLHTRIKTMLAAARRADYDEAAVLRLDPLLLAGAQATMLKNLRTQFGPEAHFAVTEAGPSLFVMAVRGGAENDVAKAVRRRLAAAAPQRLSGTRPGIMAVFLDDTDPLEWRLLREQLVLEGEARQFMTCPQARPVVAVTCVSRFELGRVGVREGDVRFRNQAHPAAKSFALAPAVTSTM